MPSVERLVRPRLVSLWQRVTPGATVLVTAQHRSGVATSVRQWLEGSGQRVVQWSSNRTEVPETAPDADVVLLELEGMRDPHAKATAAVRARWPEATLIAVTSTQWPPALIAEGIRPERVFSGALFGFTVDEVLDRAEQLGLALRWDEATNLLDRIGTHAGFVDAILRHAASRGALDEAAVRAGCDEATAHFASSAAAGVFQPNAWHAVLVTARIGPMPRRMLLSVWGRDEVVRAALDNIAQSGFFAEDLETGTTTLRQDIRDAVARRIEAEAADAAVDALVSDLAANLLAEGRTDDGWKVVAELPAARADMLERNWWTLSELAAPRARAWLEAAVQRGDATPELRIALARTLIDVSSADHSGSVPHDARRQARQLLDEAEASGSLSEPGQLVLETLRGVLLRLDGRYDDALEAHERIADRSAYASSNGSRVQLVQAGVLLQAGLSAFDAGRPDVASDRLTAAAAIAHASGHSRLAAYAHEIMLVVATKNEPISSSYQALVDNLVGAHANARPMKSLVSVWSALYVADPPALRAALDDPDAAFDDPLALGLVAAAMRSIAHGLLATSGVALRAIELFEHTLGERRLSPLHDALLTWARTEALLHVGAGDKAIEALVHAPESYGTSIPVDILLARAHLRQGEPEQAVSLLAASPHTRGAGILMVWAHALLFLAYRAIGSDGSLSVARQHLQAALVAASRARPVLPFALQGRDALALTISEAEQLALDPAGRRLVDDLRRARDALQLATGAPLALSDRERTVVAHLSRAESTRHLAQLLHVSPNTVKTQLRSIYRKLGVSSWADAVATAERLGLTE